YLLSLSATAHPQIYTLSLHDALPICAVDLHQDLVREVEAHVLVEDALEVGLAGRLAVGGGDRREQLVLADLIAQQRRQLVGAEGDRKSTRLNSSHLVISYAVFCLKKK